MSLDSRAEPDHQAPFYLADWYVDTVTNRLRKGEIEVKLESKVMAVLYHLVLNQNELVTREALEQAVWGKTVVGYDALTRCVAQLRKALNDDSRAPRYIETISKKGYRLIAPVSGETSRHQHPDKRTAASDAQIRGSTMPRKRIWITGLGLSLLVLLLVVGYPFRETQEDEPQQAGTQNQPSIVVLPFTNLDNEPEHRYFSEGMTADITTALSKLSGLLVITHSPPGDDRDNPTDIMQSPASPGSRYILQGSVRRTDGRIRVNVNLIDSGRDIYLWSEKYDRELRSVFDVQDDITSNIIKALSVKLTEEEKRHTARRYTTSIDAYDDFLRGQAHYMRHTLGDNRQARAYFQQAIDRDASFARAYSAMALTYIAEHRYAWGERSREQLDLALQLAARGKSLDTNLPQAYWVLGYVHLFRREYTEAAEAAGRAIALYPNYADSYVTLAVCRIHAGAPQEASDLVRKAMLLNPEYPAAYASVLGQSYFFTERYEQAVPVFREAIDRNNNLVTAHVFLTTALSKLDRMDEAEWAVEQLKVVAKDFSANQVSKMIPVEDASRIEDMKKQLQRAGL